MKPKPFVRLIIILWILTAAACSQAPLLTASPPATREANGGTSAPATTGAVPTPTIEATAAPTQAPASPTAGDVAAVPTQAPASAPADFPTPTPERIDFGSGGTSATVSGLLEPAGSQLYVLGAQAGQTMQVDLAFTEGRAILAVWGADGDVLMSDHAEAPRFEGVLPATQDYFIHVKGSPNGETAYEMTVTIPPVGAGEPTPAAARIRFDPGAVSATVSGHLEAAGSSLYVLEAAAGQTLTAELSFTTGEAILVVWGADGSVLISDHAEVSRFTTELPVSQDYFIHVKGRPDGETDYRLKVTIR